MRETHVNINSVVGGGIKDPNDALAISKRALELGFESTIGIIHDGSGQLKPLAPEEARVYQEMKARKKTNYAQFDKFQDMAIAEGARMTGGAVRGRGICMCARTGWFITARSSAGYPGFRWPSYTKADLKREFTTAKSCAPNCTVGCVHRISYIDHWRAPQTRTVAPGGLSWWQTATVVCDQRIGNRE